jgi:hypothetical protein
MLEMRLEMLLYLLGRGNGLGDDDPELLSEHALVQSLDLSIFLLIHDRLPAYAASAISRPLCMMRRFGSVGVFDAACR